MCGNVHGVPVSDLNEDGRLDVVAAVSPWNLLPLLGSGGGGLTFGAPHNLSAAGGQPPRGSGVGDFDHDGNVDVATTQGFGNFQPAPNSVLVSRGNGAGGFVNSPLAPTGGIGSEGLAVGDLNGDGNQDVAVTNYSTDTVSVLLGDGLGNLAPAPASPVAVGDGPWAVAVADLDEDGDRDVAVANQNSGDASILLGDGGGGFAPAPGSPIALDRGLPASITAGDLDEDGDADLVAAGFAAPSGLAVLLGDGSGHFVHGPDSPYADGNSGSWAVGLGDFDGDGNQDVANTNIGNNSMSVRLGNGAGGLGPATAYSVVTGQSLPLSDCPRPAQFPVACSPRSISVADFDGDGSDDVVAGNWNAQSVSLLLNQTNSAPTASDDDYATDEDVLLHAPARGVLGNDADADGDALAAELVTGPAHGTLSLNADGSFTYTPEAQFSGPDSFTYRASDGVADSNVATVSITVRPVNDPPVPRDDSYETDEDMLLDVPAPGVLQNDSDLEGDPVTVAGTTQPAHGHLSLDADGSFRYRPHQDFAGADSFMYQLAGAPQSSAKVSIEVRPVNDAPLARDDSYETDEDVPLEVDAPGVLENDADVEGDPLSGLAVIAEPAHGTLNLNTDGSFNYTPAENYSGEDSFDYEVSDGTAASNATVTIAVRPVNDPPVARDDAYGTDEDALLDVTAPGVLHNDTDVDGDPVTVAGMTQPAHGHLSLDADGSFRYRPHPDFEGDDSFRYQLTGAPNSSAKVSIKVSAINDAPLARDDSYETDEEVPLEVGPPGVLDNDLDVEGDSFSGLAVVTGPSHGTLNLNPDGSFSFTPAENYSGEDSFTYEVSDGSATSNVATVSITVRAVNDPPVPRDDSYATDAGIPLHVPAPGVLGNDTDPDGDSLTAVLASGPANGTLNLNADGSFTYTSGANFSGTDSFRYKPSDGKTDSGNVVGVVAISVRPDDDIVYRSWRTGNGDIYSIDSDGGPPTQLTEGGAHEADPVWSPDHTRIAFVSTRTGNPDIYTMDEHGGNVRRLTTSAAFDSAPAWSPDGTRIAFNSDRAGGNWDIYVMSAASGASVARLTTHPAMDFVPTWSPNGQRIAFASERSGGGDIYSMRAAPGSTHTRLTTSPGVDGWPDWFGSKIAFASSRHGADNFEIYTMNESGTGQTRRTVNATHDVAPAWSPDGTKLVFGGNAGPAPNFEIYTLDVTSGLQRRLTFDSASDNYPDW